MVHKGAFVNDRKHLGSSNEVALIIFGFGYGMSKKRIADVPPWENGSLVTSLFPFNYITALKN